MTPGEIVRIFNAKKAGKDKYSAKCPCHADKSRDTLSLREGKKLMLVYCWAGCDARDVLAAVGLRFRDLFYMSRDVSSEALKKHYRKQYAAKLYERERRIMDLGMILKAVNLKPYQRVKQSKPQFDRDIERFCESLHG